ncbi:unnamed protein product [Cunninghamella echinulata]
MIQEHNITSMVSIGGFPSPTIVIEYEQYNGKHIKFYTFDINNKALQELYTVESSIEATAHLLIPIPDPYGGVVAIGEYTISYYSIKGNYTSISIDAVMITTYELIDDNPHQYILGDTSGTLYFLSIRTNKNQVTDLHVQYLGEASVCSTIVYMGSDIVFFGSAQGDSMLKKIIREHGKLRLETMEVYPNLGPITDFCLFDLNKLGRQTMVCCSGINNSGSLRVIQNGYDFDEQVKIPIDGVQKIWSLNLNEVNPKVSCNKLMVLSMINCTRIIYHKYGDSWGLKEGNPPNFVDLDQPTIALSYLGNGNILQITPLHIRLTRPTDNKVDILWTPIQGTTIHSAVMGRDYIVIACSRGRLVIFEFSSGSGRFVQARDVGLSTEVSCLDIKNGIGGEKSYLAVGSWTGKKIQLFSLPDFTIVTTDTIDELVPYNIKFQKLQDISYLFVSFGDGTVMHYKINKNMKLAEKRQISLGTHPVILYPIVHNSENVILAATNQPTIISSIHNQLIYSSINIKNVTAFAISQNQPWKGSFLMATNDSIHVGTLDRIRKLHHTKISLNKKMARRIAYHEESQSIILGTAELIRNPDNGLEKSTGWISLYDANTFKEMDTHELMENELIESICIARVFDKEQLYIFVGTAITTNLKEYGRIIMYKIKNDKKLHMVDNVPVSGVVYSIKSYMNSVIASVNGSIYFLSSIENEANHDEKFNFLQKKDSKVAVLDIDTNQDLILTGDILHSMSLMKLENFNFPTMTTIAEDRHSRSMTAVKLLKNEICLGADANYNLIAMKQRYIAKKNEKPQASSILNIIGQYHLGELINKMQEGSLADKVNFIHRSPKSWTMTYVTVDGTIGIIKEITEADYESLLAVQQRLAAILPCIGNFSHNTWRGVQFGSEISEAENFLDGDLLERYLNLPTDQKIEVVKDLPCNTEQLEIKIHSLSQLR